MVKPTTSQYIYWATQPHRYETVRLVSQEGFAVGQFPDRVEVMVTGRWTDKAARLFESGEADRLVLNYAHGFSEPNLEFLQGVPVRQLVVVDRRLQSLEPISALGPTLEMLHISTRTSLNVDLSRLPHLQDLSVEWDLVRSSIARLSHLRRLSLARFDETDLASLAHLDGLRRLVLTDRPRVRSLSGVSSHPDLRELGVFYAKDLDDFSDLRRLAHVEKLELEGCKKLMRLDDIGVCAGLRWLNLSECDELVSLAPIRGMNLEDLRLAGTTKILDNDLSPIASLERLKSFRIQSRRSYQPSVEKIKEDLNL